MPDRTDFTGECPPQPSAVTMGPLAHKTYVHKSNCSRRRYLP